MGVLTAKVPADQDRLAQTATSPTISMGWRNDLSIYPAAKLFPILSNEQLQILGEDIAQNGLVSPIALLRGNPGEQLHMGDIACDALLRSGIGACVRSVIR